MIKRALIVFGIFLLALLGVALYLDPRNLNPNRHRDQIQAWIEERLNAEVKIGVIFPIVYPGLGLECRDLALRYKADPEAEPEDFFEVKSLKVIFDRKALFQERRLVWKELILESPRVYLRRGEDKQLVVKSLLKPKPVETATAPEPRSWLAKAIRENLRAQLPDPEHRFEAILNLEQVRIFNASLEIVDQGRPHPGLVAPLKLTGINFSLSGMSADEPGKFEASFRFPQARGGGLADGPLLNLSGKLEVDKDNRTLRVRSLSGAWGESRIDQADLSLSFANRRFHLVADAEADLALDGLNAVLTWPPIHRTKVVDPVQAWGRGWVRVHAEGPDSSQAWRMNFKGQAVMEKAGLDPGRVIAPITEFSGAAKIQNGVIEIPETELKVGGIPLKGSGTIEEAYAPRLVLVTEAQEVDFGKFFMRRPHPAPDPNAVMGPMRSRWEGDARIGYGYYGKIKARDIVGHWSVDTNRLLRFSNLTCRAYQGTYEDNFSWVSFNHPTDTAFFFNGQIKKMDVQKFVDGILDATTFVDGEFSGQGYVAGRFVRTDLDWKSLNGEFTVDVHDGKLIGYNLFMKVISFLGIPVKEEEYSQSFERIRATVTLRDGVAYLDDLDMKKWDLEVRLGGKIDFVREEVDLRISVYSLKALSTVTKPIPLVGALVNQTQQALFGYYAKVQGNWDNPVIGPYLPVAEKWPTRPAPRVLGDAQHPFGPANKETDHAGKNPEPR